MIRLHLNFAKHRPIRGSSFIALPCELSTCQAVLNIRNYNDNNCFVYCYIAARCQEEKIGKKVNGLKKFEELNSVQVNVFGYHKMIYFLYKIEKKSSEELVIDLLLRYDSDNHHYVLIRDL